MFEDSSVMAPARATPHPPGLGGLATAELVVGEVLAGGFVDCGDLRLRAAPALTMMHAVAPGDRVLVAREGPGRAWILAVLASERDEACIGDPAGRPIRMHAPEFNVDVAGCLRVRAAATELDTARLAVVAVEAEATFRRLSTRCTDWLLTCRQATLDTWRWLQRASTRVTTVAQADQLDAGHLCLDIRHAVRVQGEHVVVQGKQAVQIDGDRILMG